MREINGTKKTNGERLAPRYAGPYARGRADGGDAFFPDPAGGRAHIRDPLAQELAEEFLSSVTSGEGDGGHHYDHELTEEIGGPFITTTGKEEFAEGVDASNPRGATREPFPTSSARGPHK